MAAQLTSNAIQGWPENTDTVVVSRLTASGPTRTKSTIFTGACDLQEGAGMIAYNPDGGVVTADAKCIIDGNPSIIVGDECVFNGNPSQQTYLVISNSYWSMWPQHMELMLKAGPLDYRAKT